MCVHLSICTFKYLDMSVCVYLDTYVFNVWNVA